MREKFLQKGCYSSKGHMDNFKVCRLCNEADKQDCWDRKMSGLALLLKVECIPRKEIET